MSGEFHSFAFIIFIDCPILAVGYLFKLPLKLFVMTLVVALWNLKMSQAHFIRFLSQAWNQLFV